MSGAHGERSVGSVFTRAEAHQIRRLRAVFALTVVFVGFELAGALFARSQVLLADALHLLLDVLALALSIGAMRLAVRAPTDRFTFGLRRVEPLAALFNGLVVLVVALAIAREAVLDLESTTVPRPTVMLLVAVAALLVHGLSAWLIHDAIEHREPIHDHGHDHDHGHEHAHRHGHALNLRGVWLHLVGDVLGAITALVAAVVIQLGGPARVDAVGSLFVALILLVGAGKLLRDATWVLLDAAPAHLAAHVVRELVAADPGVAEVLQLRVWTLGAGHDAVAVEVRARVTDESLASRLRERIQHQLGAELVMVHVTSSGGSI